MVLRIKQKTGLWITSEILDNICNYDFYFTRTKHFLLDFLQSQQKLQRDINKKKDEYISCKIEENKKQKLSKGSI